MAEDKHREITPENCLRRVRQAAGLSQEELAALAGVARQTVGGIETGRYNPSVAVAFRLAAAVGKKVEDIFRMPHIPPREIPADWCNIREAPVCGQQVYLGRLTPSGGCIAYPVNRDSLYSDYNAIVVSRREENRLSARVIHPAGLRSTAVIIAGCSPALALLKNRITRGCGDLNIHWVNTNSMASLHSLKQGFVHIAGIHIYDEATGEYNLPVAKKVLDREKYLVINLCYGEQGFITVKGNPKGIRTFDDFSRPGIRLVNREQGAETRRLLDSGLRRAGVDYCAVTGYDLQAKSHMEVAQAVALGGADCGITLAPLAAVYNLDFITLTRERYDLVVLQENLANPGVQAILDCLGGHSFHLELEASGYSPEQCGREIWAS